MPIGRMMDQASQSGPGGAAAGDQQSADAHQISPLAIALPKGGGAIRGIGEKFAANPVTGTGSMSVPIATSPGRSGFGPQLSLSYNSGAGNGPFGFGWNLSLPSITRKTDKGLPRYLDEEESDVFILSGAEDLVPVLNSDGSRHEDADTYPGYTVHRYRPRIEGLFARIERWTNSADPADVHWRSISRDNILTIYGKDENSRIADPEDPARIFSWLICETRDDRGNALIYRYKEEDGAGVVLSQAHERNRGDRDDVSRTANRYLKYVLYGNRVSLLDHDGKRPRFLTDEELSRALWMFEVVLDYGEGHYEDLALDPDRPEAEQHRFARATAAAGGAWPVRSDPFSSYRAGFEVRTYRLCHRVLMFHHFPDELGRDDCLVRSTEFSYDERPVASFITSVTQSGYVHQSAPEQPDRYLKRSLPPLEFEYSRVPTQAELDEQPVESLEGESLENLPAGLNGGYQWVDLDGVGISGILTEQAGAWFYKPNLGNGHLGPLQTVAAKPSLAALNGGRQQLLDLAGDGQLDLVEFAGPTPGYYERTHDEGWATLRTFASLPAVDWADPNLRFVDLTGDGYADILITEDGVFTWHLSLAEAGFDQAERVQQALDEERGPHLVFADGSQSIFLSDMSGDGLVDLARVRNGEACYWPNLGYGRFGAKVTMDNAPWFDAIDLYDPRRIRLADIDGSGTTDIIYLGRDCIDIYANQAGNSWAQPLHRAHFPRIDNLSEVAVVDLTGNGTACLVWCSPLAGDTGQPLRYIDLMGGGKPHLLVKVTNNLGAETQVQYAPSTKFYLEDKAAGQAWITRLPFPVHVVERVVTYDHVSRNRFVTRYTYHHGYFDGEEREFRGFARVDQWDTEEYATLKAGGELGEVTNWDEASHVPPVHTVTWFHTGIYLGRDQVSNYFAGLVDEHDLGEYYREPAWREDDDEARRHLLPDTVLPAGLTLEEEREACRALKGSMLRQEVYADDAGPESSEAEIRRAGIPYTVVEQNFSVRRLQPHDGNRHAVFFTHPREVITYHYERNPNDPRVQHALTLEVDEFGNVVKSAAVGYGRRQTVWVVDELGEIREIPNPGLDELDARDQEKQTIPLITYTENSFTRDHDTGTALIDNDYDYRTPLPCESRTYELTELSLAADSDRFTFEQMLEAGAVASPLNYEQESTPGVLEKRLIEAVRTRYRRNDLDGALPFCDLQSLALPFESYKLAFTPGLLDAVYRRDGEDLLPDRTDVLSGTAGDEGGYVELDGDGCWWIPSGQVFYHPDAPPNVERTEAWDHFFLQRRFRDPFGSEAIVDYDGPVVPDEPGYDLLVTHTIDALDNEVHAENDYRVLQPRLVTDPNGNRSEVAFDALGLVAGTAVMGKVGEDKGDLLDYAFEADLTQARIDELYDGDDPHVPAPDLLRQATTRIVYDLDCFRRTCREHPAAPDEWRPACAATLARETHHFDPLPPDGLKIQISFSYSDGFGREIQKKIQAEPGPVPARDATDKIIVGDDGQPELAPDDAPVRWVGSGWTVFNNKGKPVRQYEPFFTDRHAFEFEACIGISPVLFYDPVARVIATLHPNHTYEKVVFDPWQQATYDVNDTVAARGDETGDPRTDPDIAGFVEAYFAAEPDSWQTWYVQRQAGAMGTREQAAAHKAAVHADTPTTVHLDALGRPFLTVARNRFERDGVPVEEQYVTCVELDIEGNQGEVIDAKDRIVMCYEYDMLGNRIHQSSMEAGERWILNDVAGKPIRAWDSRGFTRCMTYDALRRPIGMYVIENGRERLAECTVYGEAVGDTGNLRTRVYQTFDAAGVVTSSEYDFKGNLLESRRDLLPDYKQAVDWNEDPDPSDGSFTTSTTYDALNHPCTIITPDGSVQHPVYNEANLLERLEVNLRGAAEATPVVTDIDYDAKGRRTSIRYGNGAATLYEYDPLTFRLTNLRTTRPAGLNGLASQIFADPTVVQDLRYTYDPAGNISRIEDASLRTVFHDGERVEPVCDYVYDALYRLIEARGREHIGQAGFELDPPPDNRRDYPFFGLRASPHDPEALRNYIEQYEYDAVGNFEVMRHSARDGNWTRRYEYEEASLIEPTRQSNRLTRTRLGNGFSHVETYTYADAGGHDVHGCMTAINSMDMAWDFEDQLQASSRQVREDGGTPEITHYVYDAAGQRVRKVTERQAGPGETPTRMKERIYLGGFEIYREFSVDGEHQDLQRETLHVMDDQQRTALVETKTVDGGAEVALPSPVLRFQLGNHLGSSSLELTEDAWLISYEEYYPYGSTSYRAVIPDIEVSAKRYRYTGMERDEETGLAYHGMRYFIIWIGRWLSCDPVGISDGNNMFMYARGNPLRFVDRLGRSSDPDEDVDQPRPTLLDRASQFLESLVQTVFPHAAEPRTSSEETTSDPDVFPEDWETMPEGQTHIELEDDETNLERTEGYWEARLDESLQQHGINPEFVALHGTLLEMTGVLAREWSYEEFHRIRGRHIGPIAPGWFNSVARTARGEPERELVRRARGFARRLAFGRGGSSVVRGAILTAEGLELIVEESRWNARDDRARFEYRERLIYAFLLTQVAKEMADESSSNYAEQVERIRHYLFDQTRRLRGWEAGAGVTLRQMVQREIAEARVQDLVEQRHIPRSRAEEMVRRQLEMPAISSRR